MSLWTMLDGGLSLPSRKTFWQRVSLWFGYRLAVRHENVHIHHTCMISPEAKVNPREGVIQIEEESSIGPGVLVQGNVRMGKNSSIQAYSNIVGYGKADNQTGQITIGDNVRIASHTIMIAANHNFDDVNKPITKQGLKYAPIIIEDDVWIAARVNIMAGVTIGKGSVIGAGSVVTKDIPPYSIAVGVPARVVKKRGE